MRVFISIILSVSVLFQNLNSFFILANYQINKIGITAKFCENKNNPQLHCNGKCHLNKKLKEEDKKERSPISSIKDKNEIQYISNFENTISCNRFVFTNQYIPFLTGMINDFSSSVFHPPSLT